MSAKPQAQLKPALTIVVTAAMHREWADAARGEARLYEHGARHASRCHDGDTARALEKLALSRRTCAAYHDARAIEAETRPIEARRVRTGGAQ
jgi:hypothetical protein